MCRVRRCWNWRNGRPCIAPSIGHPRRLRLHPPCARRSTGLPSWAASWPAGAMGNPGRRCCGKGFNISRISLLCTVSCARPPRSAKNMGKDQPGWEGVVAGSGLPVVHAPPGGDPHADEETTRCGADPGATSDQPSAPPAAAADRACQQQCEALSHCERPDPAVEGGRPRSRDGALLCPAQFPGAPAPLAAHDLIGINSNGVHVISQIRSNQNIRVGQRHQHVADYFATHPGPPHRIRIRGGEEVSAMVGSARLYLCAHKTKRFIVAIKYQEEETYRYLIASNLSWRTLDIVQSHTLRWLVEVFIQDWKSYEGWSQLTKQPGDEGARHSVILSLLVDHSLFLHPDQQRQLKNNLPAYTVGVYGPMYKCSAWSRSSTTWYRPTTPRRNSSASPTPCTRSLPSAALRSI